MKRKHFMMAGVMLAMATGMTSCVISGRGLSMTEEPQMGENRQLKDFEEIEISGSPTVYYTQADSFSVRVEGPESYVSDILTEVKGRTLTIRNRGKVGFINISRDYDNAAVYVSSPDLTSILLSGSGDFISQQRVDTDNMRIVLRGPGDIEFKNIISDRCETELTGSGDISVGRLETLQSVVSLIGSGDIKLVQWDVADTDVSLRGSGDIAVSFEGRCQRAQCQLTGSGDIKLSGRLGHYSGQKRGSGDIDTDKLSVEK